jgi:hypothetical protein
MAKALAPAAATALLGAVLLAGCGSMATRGGAGSQFLPSSQTRTTSVSKPSARPAATTTTSSEPTARYCEDGHCATVSCPPPNPAEDWICGTSRNPGARAAVQTTTTSTSTAPAASPLDCVNDGTGGGTWVASDNNGAGGCEYSLNFSRWCGSVGAAYRVVSPPGTFLVGDGYEGGGLAFFRWSDGTEAAQQRVCMERSIPGVQSVPGVQP